MVKRTPSLRFLIIINISQWGYSFSFNYAEKESDEKCCLSITDIDANHNDPRMCSIYALEIYEVLRVIEVCKMLRFVDMFLYSMKQYANHFESLLSVLLAINL